MRHPKNTHFRGGVEGKTRSVFIIFAFIQRISTFICLNISILAKVTSKSLAIFLSNSGMEFNMKSRTLFSLH